MSDYLGLADDVVKAICIVLMALALRDLDKRLSALEDRSITQPSEEP